MSHTFFIISITEKMPKKTDLVLKSICYELGLKANCITSKQLRTYAKYSIEYKLITDIFLKIKKNACVTIISPINASKEIHTVWTLENIHSAVHTIKKNEEHIKKEQDIHFVGVIYNNTFLKIETLEQLNKFNRENKKEKTEILNDISSVTNYAIIQLAKKAQDYANVYSTMNQKIMNQMITKKYIYI